MASAYFDKADLEARIGATVVQKVYDDDNSGAADTGPLARLIADASSFVDSYLRPIYTLPLPTVPGEVKRLALDVAEFMAAKRYPEIMDKDWEKLRKAAVEDLDKLRSGKTRLDVAQGTPPEPANSGGKVGLQRSSADTCPAPGRLFDDMGDFAK